MDPEPLDCTGGLLLTWSDEFLYWSAYQALLTP